LPVAAGSDAVAMFRTGLAEGRSPIRQRGVIETRAEELLGEDAGYRRLRTLPGVGPVNAPTILAEGGGLRRLAHHRQFLKYCGLDLSTHQSGQFRGQTRLSKFGNARLRRTFRLAGQVAIRQRDNGFRDKFERYVARDRHNPDLRRKALSAIAAKMARTAHAIVKRGVDHRPFFEGVVPGGRTSLGQSRRDALRSRR
jgi:transposase